MTQVPPQAIASEIDTRATTQAVASEIDTRATTQAVARLEPGPLAAEYRERIVAAYGRIHQAAAEVGALLLEAKDKLPHGTFEAMIAADLPFGASTARRLMIVARTEWLNRAPAHALPTDWTVCYELTKLGEEGFQAALEAGAVTADSTRAEVARLVRRRKAAQASAALPEAPPVIGCTEADLIRAAEAGVRFGAIYADPPWPYETWSDKGADKSPERHYDTLDIGGLCALGDAVRALAAPDCVLVMWVVPWHLPAALEVIPAWGFTLKSTAFTWLKAELRDGDLVADLSTGKWTRKGVEWSLLATRGSPSPLGTDVRDWHMARAKAHSEKPEHFVREIERMAAGPYLELFARRPRPGWSVWGDQVAPDGVFARDGETGGAE